MAAFNDEGYINKYVQSLKDALEELGKVQLRPTSLQQNRRGHPESW